MKRRPRIYAHFVLAGLGLMLAHPTPTTNIVGTALVLAGVLIRIWAAGVLEKGIGRLCTAGPYQYVRHPLYLGSLIAAAGFCVMVNVVWAWAVLLPALIVFYTTQMLYEERRLWEEFGDAHAAYSRTVPMIVPSLRRAASQGGRWSLRRALINREQYHVTVTLALVAVLYLLLYRSKV